MNANQRILGTVASCFLSSLGAQSALAGPVLYVDVDAAGANNGSSWANAFTDLQDALFVAGSGDEIWVAEGTYTPAGPGGPRAATFQLKSGVAMYAGFDGSESSRWERQIFANPVFLSGDLNGNDNPVPVPADNAYHVVTGVGVDCSCVLNGFRVILGNADAASAPHDRGAALFLDGASPTITDCNFSISQAFGAGGGASLANGSNPVFTNCWFGSNISGTFAGPQSGAGAGMYVKDSSPKLVNCYFLWNKHIGNNGEGGAMYIDGGGPTLINCTFTGNESYQTYDAIFVHPFNSLTTTIKNSIFWDNRRPESPADMVHTGGGGPMDMSYSCVEGGMAGEFNFGSDPLIELTPELFAELQPGSPCIDAADARAYDGPAHDAHPVSGTWAARLNDDYATPNTGIGPPKFLDIGAFEFGPRSGVQCTCPGDADGNGIIDVNDISYVIFRLGTVCP